MIRTRWPDGRRSAARTLLLDAHPAVEEHLEHVVDAYVVDPHAASGLRLTEVPDPDPGPGDVLVEVTGFSLNFGEVHGLGAATPGSVPGWESGGTVVRAAADGTGPAVGTPVIAFDLAGGWARRRAVPSRWVAPLDPGVDPATASTVLVAGGTALRALRRLGDLAGRRVLITGATGGVGRFAVQLAAAAGARPVATTRSPARHGEALRAPGAVEVRSGPEEVEEPVVGVIDSVGGEARVAAFERLADHGTLLTVGHARDEDTVFPFPVLRGGVGNHDRSVTTFYLGAEPDLPPDWTWLAARVADGSLDPGVAWRGPWTDVPAAATALAGRTLNGKAVADLG